MGNKNLSSRDEKEGNLIKIRVYERYLFLVRKICPTKHWLALLTLFYWPLKMENFAIYSVLRMGNKCSSFESVRKVIIEWEFIVMRDAWDCIFTTGIFFTGY